MITTLKTTKAGIETTLSVIKTVNNVAVISIEQGEEQILFEVEKDKIYEFICNLVAIHKNL